MNLRANSKLWLAGGIISILLVVGAYFASIAFAAGPDLTITSLTRNISDPSAFDLITYSVDLANIGDAVAGPSTLRLSIGNGAEVVDFAVPSISPATTFSYEHTTALPASAGYVDTATADLNGDVAEDDETNNVLAPGPYTVVPHQVYTVNSINDADDGTCNILHCSLREAINASNLKIGKDLIAFNIDGLGPHVIQPTSALPTLTDRTAIDGTTEPDFVLGLVTTPPIVLDGSSAGFGNTGLTIDAGLSHILGLFIHSFDGPGMWINDSPGTYVLDNVISGNGTYALNIEGANATGNIVQGNLIGTNVTGDAALPNGPGVRIANASNNTIGGSLASERNVISGNNTYGVAVSGVTSSDNTIQGNYIGIDVSGSSAIGNGSHGVWIIDAAQTNVIDNVVSGNDSVGVLIIDSATGTMVQGNFIGTDSTGSAALGNQFHGVSIQTGASNTTVGGAFASERNIISGNARSGVVVILSSSNNTIEGNYIGTDSTGALDLGNTELGVLIDGSPQNNVLDNVISGNDSHGIMVFRPGSTNNDIRGNLIGTNASGSGAVPNTGAGIYFQGGTTNNTVGGLLVSDRNLISGNLESGVHIDDNTTTGNTVRGNYIGTDSTGALDIGNGLRGVFLDNSPGNSILNNLISGNDDHGVFVFNFQASGNIVQGNMIGTTAAGNV
ncbi:MAG: right-handed parallel beta-helix repeat-containing protein, partial [SAR202 cluster bacterium]|nr:right-handed parallel beta-helix repeat-containing protein [SAR202 cluster bacterium]